jgi:hypothetical protein
MEGILKGYARQQSANDLNRMDQGIKEQWTFAMSQLCSVYIRSGGVAVYTHILRSSKGVMGVPDAHHQREEKTHTLATTSRSPDGRPGHPSPHRASKALIFKILHLPNA